MLVYQRVAQVTKWVDAKSDIPIVDVVEPSALQTPSLEWKISIPHWKFQQFDPFTTIHQLISSKILLKTGTRVTQVCCLTSLILKFKMIHGRPIPMLAPLIWSWRLGACLTAPKRPCNGKREVQSQQTRPDHLKSSQKSSQILVVKQ